MKQIIVLISFLVLVVGCKKPFSQTPEMALALPTNVSTTISIVFIAGFDEGDNTYYANAKNYFEGKKIRVVDNLFSLEEIIRYINQENTKHVNFDEIHIVSHSNAWLGMSLKTSKNGKRITIKTLQNASQQDNSLELQKGITNDTKIIFHSCGLGENKALLKELKHSFTKEQKPTVYASSFFNVFGGKFAGHYLAKPYYGYYPTAESPGPAQLSMEFKLAYPESEINWFTALKTRRESSLGEAYSFKFNIPVAWEFTFDNVVDIPKLEDSEAIMDWISESPEMAEVLFELNIPIEKYRWRSKIQGNKLVIKGKTTVLCVLAPILQQHDSNEYRNVRLDDRSLYQIL